MAHLSFFLELEVREGLVEAPLEAHPAVLRAALHQDQAAHPAADHHQVARRLAAVERVQARDRQVQRVQKAPLVTTASLRLRA